MHSQNSPLGENSVFEQFMQKHRVSDSKALIYLCNQMQSDGHLCFMARRATRPIARFNFRNIIQKKVLNNELFAAMCARGQANESGE